MPRTYSALTPDEQAHFLAHGWLLVPGAIRPEYVRAWTADLWTRLGWDAHDKATWTDQYVKLPRHREARAEDVCPAAWAKMVELVGGEDAVRPDRERYYGDQLICNFGAPALVGTTHDPKTLRGWHTDNDWYRQFLDSSGNALTLILCLTDVLPAGGGTVLCEDGLARICETLRAHPEGLDPPFAGLYDHIPACTQFHQVEAKAGDVLITHGLLPHTHSPNHRHYARVVANPHVCLSEPYNLNRPDGDYTLCEQVILRALGRTSVPEYAPTRPRLAFYPRTAFFKREKVRAELARMVAAAEARGLSAADVDSVYLRGGAALAAHEARNGYDLPFGPTGVQAREGAAHTLLMPESKHHVV